MSKKGIGIIGCGAAAREYYLPIFKKYPELSSRIFLVDKNLSQAKQMAEEMGSANFTDDYHTIFGEVNGVIIAVPHFLHFSIAHDFLKNGIHVLCEKPLTESATDASVLVQTAQKQGVSLMVNNTRRLFPSFQKIKSFIASGELGRLQSVSYMEAEQFGWQSATGFYFDPALASKGVFLDLGAHAVDLVCWWLGAKPRLISFRDDSFGGPESVACFQAEHENCRIEIFLNRLNDLDNRFQVVGELAAVEGRLYDWNELNIRYKNGRRKTIKLSSDVKSYPEFVGKLVDNFLQIIEGKGSPLIPAEEVLLSIELIDEAYLQRQRFQMLCYENPEELIYG